jgi:hypothetical protein
VDIGLMDLVRVTIEEGWVFSTVVVIELFIMALGIWFTFYYLDKLSRHFKDES